MTWMDKLERKLGRHAIPNITRFFIIANILGIILGYLTGGLSLTFTFFDFGLILKGQIWRLISWILIPSSGLGFLDLLFIFCLWMLGNSLESYLGTFKMNVYFIGGIIFSDVVAIIVYLTLGQTVILTMYHMLFALYLMLGLFMPDAEVRLYFVLPIRMKWLTILYFIMLVYNVYQSFSEGLVYGIAYGLPIIISVVNLLFFVFSCKNRVSLKHRKRQREFKNQFKNVEPRPGSGITRHKCAICGRTENDDPNLTFRYCSKCVGNLEYCQDHLFTHTHVQ